MYCANPCSLLLMHELTAVTSRPLSVWRALEGGACRVYGNASKHSR